MKSNRAWKFCRVLFLCALELALGASVPLTGAGTQSKQIVLEFQGTAEDTTDQTTYTYTTQPLGVPSTDRCIVVAIGSEAGVARTLDSATIGGVAATILVTANDASGGADISSIFSAIVPTGTTGTITATFSGAMLRSSIGIWRMSRSTNCATPTDTQTDITISGSSGSLTLNVPADGGAVGAFWVNPTSGTATTTWTGLTEDFDDSNVEGNGFSGASTRTANAALAVQATSAATISRMGLAAASFAP